MDYLKNATASLLSFMAELHHEIRSPLNTILNMTELAIKEQPDPSIKNYIETIEKSANTLLTLLDDIIELSSEDIDYADQDAFALTSVLEDVKETIDGPRLSKGVDLGLDIHEDVPEYLKGSRARMRQILTQLLNFAMRQLNSKAITLCIEPLEDKSGLKALSFRLDARQISVPDGKDIKGPASDLRLLICKNLLQNHGDTLQVEEETDGWSLLFSIIAESAGENFKEGPLLQNLSLPALAVIVSSDRFSSDIVCRGLSQAGFDILTTDSVTGVARISGDLSRTDRQTVCLLNWHDVSHLDDLGVSAICNGAGHMPIVIFEIPAVQMMNLVSAKKAKGTGIPEHAGLVMMPSRGRQLLMEIAAVLGWDADRLFAETKTGKGGKVPENEFKGLKILVVEDDRINQRLVVELLKKRDTKPVVASTGNAALRAAQSRDFDAIFMDINLPDIDGYELTRRLRTIERHAATPIIALTASTKNRKMCLEAGMNDFITKPYSEDNLFEILAKNIT